MQGQAQTINTWTPLHCTVTPVCGAQAEAPQAQTINTWTPLHCTVTPVCGAQGAQAAAPQGQAQTINTWTPLHCTITPVCGAQGAQAAQTLPPPITNPVDCGVSWNCPPKSDAQGQAQTINTWTPLHCTITPVCGAQGAQAAATPTITNPVDCGVSWNCPPKSDAQGQAQTINTWTPLHCTITPVCGAQGAQTLPPPTPTITYPGGCHISWICPPPTGGQAQTINTWTPLHCTVTPVCGAQGAQAAQTLPPPITNPVDCGVSWKCPPKSDAQGQAQTINTWTPLHCTITPVCGAQGAQAAAPQGQAQTINTWTPLHCTVTPVCGAQGAADQAQTINTWTPLHCTVTPVCGAQGAQAAPQGQAQTTPPITNPVDCGVSWNCTIAPICRK